MPSTNKCLICSGTFGDPKDFVRCDGCRKIVCKDCSGLAETELRCLALKKRTLSYYCQNCERGIALIPDLLKQIADLQTEISEIKKTVQSNSPKFDAESVYAEIQDRAIRSKNILIHNIDECPSSNFNERIDHDTRKCRELFTAMELDAGDFKVWRLGPASNKKRPVKVTFSDSSLALSSVKNRRKLIPRFSNIRISADLTPAQRNHIKSLHEQLEERRRKGEDNLIIQYKYGVPRITTKKAISSKN